MGFARAPPGASRCSMHTRGKGRTSWHPVLSLLFAGNQKGCMRFTVRSLGGKLMVSAALTLVLCLLCFSAASWYLLKIFYEHEAKHDASIHLAPMRRAYQTQTALLTSELAATASSQTLVMALTQPSTASSDAQIISIFTSTL